MERLNGMRIKKKHRSEMGKMRVTDGKKRDMKDFLNKKMCDNHSNSPVNIVQFVSKSMVLHLIH